MYVNYNTRNTTQHHNSIHSKEQKEKEKKVRSSRTTRIWALISPFPSRQPQFTSLTSLGCFLSARSK